MSALLLKALISAVVWSLSYLYIRRYLNPEIDNYRKYQTDSLYGGLAAFAATIGKDLLMGLVDE